MRVLITGGSGHIGRVTTERLLQNGWEVRVIDLTSETKITGAEYIQCNILNYDDLLKHMRGCDAVIHLAAIRTPYLAPGHEIFQLNVAGTFNVFEAAAASGIRRVIQASSINALGAYYNLGEIQPLYFPIDEDHPRFTTDPYSFSKQVIEDIGAYYWRREGLSSLALRFPGVYSGEYFATETFREGQNAAHNLLDELLARPESEQRTHIADIKKRVLNFRSQRPLEFHPEQPGKPLKLDYDDLLFKLYTIDRFNLWAFIHELDAAQSLEKGLTAYYEGDHVIFINASCNLLNYDSRALIRLFFPEVNQFKSGLSGADTLVSIERARSLIGFEPEHTITNTTSS
jgi:nucleoside-diphosphate-sugar epimerase